MSKPKPCPTCDKSFHGPGKYCSFYCIPANRRHPHSHTKQCPTCHKEYTGRANQVFCSQVCRPSQSQNINGRLDLPTATVGAIAEMAVCADLLRHGYAVFRAISPACYCDILAKKDNSILEIEVRTGFKRHGHWSFAKGRHNDVTHFAVWDKERLLVAYIAPDTLEEIML